MPKAKGGSSAVAAPMRRPLQTSTGAVSVAPLLLVDLRTSQGIVGRSYLFAIGRNNLRPLAALVEAMGEMLKGDPVAPFEIERQLRDRRVEGLHLISGEPITPAQIEAYRNAQGGRIRGGSTISQQTAKNAFLWQGGGYVRKALEAWFTVLIETLWGKKRIMEVYLNLAETGIGTYGVEAGSIRYFNHSADKLSPTEAGRIAAVLPLPTELYDATAIGRESWSTWRQATSVTPTVGSQLAHS
mgnify:CR=1 FL=1